MSKRKSFTTFVLDNAWNVEFPTEPAGVLRLGPGKIQVQARITERLRSEGDWYAVLDCELRIADAWGKVWQATGTFRSDWLFYPLINLARKETPRWLRNAPEEWRTALRDRALIRAVPWTDDRNYRAVWIDNTAVCFQLDYICVNYDIAALSADQCLVQVSRATCSWNSLPVAGPDGTPLPVSPARPPLTEHRRSESGDGDEIQPLAYTLDAGRILFRNTGVEDSEGWWDQAISRPLLFRRTRGKGEAQRVVTFHAAARPTPSARLPADDDTQFVRTTQHSNPELEVLTDAGGWLRVDSFALTGDVKLDRYPGATGPEDVLRCRLRLTDEVGDLWEGVSVFTPEVFFEKLEDLEYVPLRDFEGAEEPWHPPEGSLLGVRAHLDDGGWRYLLLYNDLVAFHTDDQHPRLDVSPDGTGFAVRLTGLIGRRRPVLWGDYYIELDPEARKDEVPGWDHDQPLPGIRFSVSLLDLCFRNTTFAVDEGFWHGNAIPIPVVFTRIGKGKPNPGIRFVPDEEAS
jgi:hypothetical protein